jgi:transposase-like protein
MSKVLSIILVVSLLLGSARGRADENRGSQDIESPDVWLGSKTRRKRRRKYRDWLRKRAGYLVTRSRSWHVPLLRGLLLWALWQLSGQIGSGWLALLPWLIWLLPANKKPLERIRDLMWHVHQILLMGYLGLGVYHLLGVLLNQSGWSVGLLGCVVCVEEPKVEIKRAEDGGWQVDLQGHFTLKVSDDHPFRLRLLIIFLGQLQSEHDGRKSRRTRDGRTPFVRQEQLAGWTNTKQEHISLWMKHWLKGDWAHLLSLTATEVLTPELVERIVTVFATFPNWTTEQVYEHLHKQGCEVTYTQIEQASRESGWKQLITALRERFDLKAGLFLRDEWLVGQLLNQIQALLAKVEAFGGLTPEVHATLDDLQTLSAQVGAVERPPLPAKPWLLSLERTLLGSWEQVSDEVVCCTYCGSSAVSRKSKKARQKKFYDTDGQVKQAEVCRYYCHNPECAKKSFTYFPAGLVPYSPYRAQMHLLTLQMYAWGYSTYRRSSTAMGICSMTAWRWVNAWGHDLLPMAALFGVVRSSGAIGVDEKYILVPKNNKPGGKMRRWMYVYLAVDAWTYDLLHIEIYPYNNDDSAKAFLLALRAKGYHPQTIVTDLRQDYGPVINFVFPDAEHHECIFHAMQNAQKHIKDVYGPRYAIEHPEAAQLKQLIYNIFDTQSLDEAQSRYQDVLKLKSVYVIATPDSIVIFDFLERHWPKLCNAIGSSTIPTTNNTTELVIRRFDQHYQNFCGFESIESAHSYLAIFEKLYRFTPFSQDAQPCIRGLAPLQLAGYDISHFPMSAICSGLSVDWPTEANLVPK